MAGRAIRRGAAALLLGLSLAGPHGVASADPGEDDSASVTAGPAVGASRAEAAATARSTTRRSAGTSARSAVVGRGLPTATRAVDDHPTSMAAHAVLLDGPAARITAVPAAPRDPQPAANPTTPATAPRAAAAVELAAPTAPALASAVAEAPSTAAAIKTRPRPVSALPPTIGSAIEHFLDSAVNWLDSLPTTPFTDLLSGAVWLVRRTLFPVGPGVGPGGTAACVATKDCSGQDLQGVDLQGQDLSGVNFAGANLTGANLYRSRLWEADFSEANLIRANLGQASTFDADFSGAILTKANLRGARLSGANFEGARLKEANLYGAVLAGTDFTYADLSYTDLRFTYTVVSDLTNFSYATLYGAQVNYRNWESSPIYDNTVCPNGSFSTRPSYGCMTA